MKIELMGKAIAVHFTANDADEVIRKKLFIALLRQNNITFTEQNNPLILQDEKNNLEVVRYFYNQVMPAATELLFAGYFIYLKHRLEQANISFDPENATCIESSKQQRCQTFSDPDNHHCSIHYFLYAEQLKSLPRILAADHHKFKDLHIKRRLAIAVTLNENYCILLLKIDHHSFAGKTVAQAELTILTNDLLANNFAENAGDIIETAYQCVLPLCDIKIVNLTKYSTDSSYHWKLTAQAVSEWLTKDYLFLSAQGDAKGDSLPAMGGLATKPSANFDIKSASAPNTPLLGKKNATETNCITLCKTSCSIM